MRIRFSQAVSDPRRFESLWNISPVAFGAALLAAAAVGIWLKTVT